MLAWIGVSKKTQTWAPFPDLDISTAQGTEFGALPF